MHIMIACTFGAHLRRFRRRTPQIITTSLSGLNNHANRAKRTDKTRSLLEEHNRKDIVRLLVPSCFCSLLLVVNAREKGKVRI